MPGRPDFANRANAESIEQLYAHWRENPDSVPESWRLFFSGVEFGERRDPSTPAGSGGVYGLVQAYREFGHLVANLDPLGENNFDHPFLDLANFGLGDGDLDRDAEPGPFRGEFRGTLRQLVSRLRQIYGDTLAAEFVDISDKVERDWIEEQLEGARPSLSASDRIRILRGLLTADAFEQFLHARYTGHKRFSLEGGATLIPMFEHLIAEAGGLGVTRLTIGMPHRGRLNFLANIMKKPLEMIFSEFEASAAPAEVQGHGDVKYHLGYTSSHPLADGRTIQLNLHYNPSHLEFVNPVVLGSMRALQDVMQDAARDRGIPVLLHGDAAFAGEGIVPETLAMAQLPAHETGGTIHVIVNNQVGFTTSPHDSRATRYPTAIARTVDAPVLHVNGDDPEAAIRAMSIALAYRMRFKKDVFIDLVCYRKHGHNEMDDPTFTQPVMYAKIAKHVPAARRYAERLVGEQVLDAAALEKVEKEIETTLRAAHARASAAPHTQPLRDTPRGLWRGLDWAGRDWTSDTRVPRATLELALHGITKLPEGFHAHRKIAALVAERRKMFLEDRIDWGLGEALAFGTLLLEGRGVRLTGQDAGRGTFTHRHAAVYDTENGRRHVALQHLAPEQGRFEVVDTMLSEAAVLGFEYGYSTTDPHTLVIWEAQFGDFANVAQVYMDQFIASGESKWGRMSGITLLLPHGYEGQGPEHSSARLERFLELCADDNMQVCNLTTPAQLFHALRRQLHRTFRKPLVVMSPKSLLRHKAAISPVSEFETGTFQPVLDDATVRDPGAVRSVLIVSGRFSYTLLEARAAVHREDVAIVRLEQMYPFPGEALAAVFARFPKLERVRWVQEEPSNMGAWRQLRHRLEAVLPAGAPLELVARRSSPTPASGFYAMHVQQEQSLLARAFSEGALPAPEAEERAAEGVRR